MVNFNKNISPLSTVLISSKIEYYHKSDANAFNPNDLNKLRQCALLYITAISRIALFCKRKTCVWCMDPQSSIPQS